MMSAAPARLVLGMADADDYASLGLNPRVTRGVELPPGRAFIAGSVLVQCAVVGDDPGGDAQLRAIDSLATRLRKTYPDDHAPGVHSLPESVSLTDGSIGVYDADLAPLRLQPADGNLLIAGPRRSGRTTALATIAHALHAAGVELRLLALRREVLDVMPIWSATAIGADAVATAVRALTEELETRDSDAAPCVVLIDDAHDLSDFGVDEMLARLVRFGGEHAVTVIAAVETQAAHRAYGGWLAEMKKLRRALLLMPDPDVDGELAGLKLPRTAVRWVPGRGYLVNGTDAQLVQLGRT
jgi:S-DNA-T family DNA segregation ATPase FtsK/SpoIIIE